MLSLSLMLIGVSTVSSITWYKQTDYTCAFAALNNCAQERVFNIPENPDCKLSKIYACPSCFWKLRYPDMAACKEHCGHFDVSMPKIIEIIERYNYILEPVPAYKGKIGTTGTAIAHSLIDDKGTANDPLCIIFDLHGTRINHATTLKKEGKKVFYLDSNLNFGAADDEYADNAFKNIASRELKAHSGDVAGVETWVEVNFNEGLKPADKEKKLWIQNAYTVRKKKATAKEEYFNLLVDYEYDIAVEEARKERAIKLLKHEKQNILRAKQRIKNVENDGYPGVTHKRHKKYQYN